MRRKNTSQCKLMNYLSFKCQDLSQSLFLNEVLLLNDRNINQDNKTNEIFALENYLFHKIFNLESQVKRILVHILYLHKYTKQ